MGLGASVFQPLGLVHFNPATDSANNNDPRNNTTTIFRMRRVYADIGTQDNCKRSLGRYRLSWSCLSHGRFAHANFCTVAFERDYIHQLIDEIDSAAMGGI